MGSTVVSIPDREVVPKEDKLRFWLPSLGGKRNMRKGVHSVKVGLALVLVSLLYLVDPLYERIGDNAMWAIMTVVVIFEFFAGALLSKGLNRGIGTVLGGGLGCLAAAFAQEAGGGTRRAIVVGFSVFIFGTGATYSRLMPSIKRTYDYGAMIFILTFNLVVVSGLRGDDVMQIARERLLTICMGFVVAVSVSLIVFPTWAGDELHDSTASEFKDLAITIQGCVEEMFRKDSRSKTSFNGCTSVLHSKAKDESLANFAKWEPWHGRFGLSHPWNKYLKIGDALRDLAATTLSLKCCLQTANKQKNCLNLKQTIKGPSEDVGSLVVWSLRELGESILQMRRSRGVGQNLRLNSLRLQLTEAMSGPQQSSLKTNEELAMATFVFLLMEIVDKVEAIAMEVEELAQAAGFHAK